MVTNKIINNYESNVLELASLFLKIFVQHLVILSLSGPCSSYFDTLF